MKIGILGGTFNPIHNGHLILAQNALELCNLDKVYVMPSYISYFKNPEEIASVNHRVNMVKEAVEDNALLELSTIETDRGGNSYTYETIISLKEQSPDNELYYIIGADTLFSMESWKCPEIIFNNCTIVCAKRDNYDELTLNEQINKLQNKYKTSVILIEYPEVTISSTTIRSILKSNKSARYYIPDRVREYIEVNSLYH